MPGPLGRLRVGADGRSGQLGCEVREAGAPPGLWAPQQVGVGNGASGGGSRAAKCERLWAPQKIGGNGQGAKESSRAVAGL